MTKEERKLLESECVTKNLRPEVACKMGKLIGYDEVMAELQDCIDNGVETFSAAVILLNMVFRPKIADLANELTKRE